MRCVTTTGVLRYRSLAVAGTVALARCSAAGAPTARTPVGRPALRAHFPDHRGEQELQRDRRRPVGRTEHQSARQAVRPRDAILCRGSPERGQLHRHARRRYLRHPRRRCLLLQAEVERSLLPGIRPRRLRGSHRRRAQLGGSARGSWTHVEGLHGKHPGTRLGCGSMADER